MAWIVAFGALGFLIGRLSARGPAPLLDGLHRIRRAWWRWRSRRRGGRPPIDRALIALIRRMRRENPLWGAERILGELRKLGFELSKSTVEKYMGPRPKTPAPGWLAFLRSHAEDIAAIDMLTVETLGFERLYAFVVLGLQRRCILHVEVTAHPAALWLARQVTEAFPWDTAPAFIIRDNDRAYGQVFRRRLKAMGVRDKPTMPYSPWQNGYAERLIGSIRRDCLDHVIILNEAHLRRVLKRYARYYNHDRTHLGLDMDTPSGRAVEAAGRIISRPILGGLHHRYERKPGK